MTDDEIKAAIEKAAETAAIRGKILYEKAKEETDAKYREMVAKWGRRITNTVLISGTIVASFAAGYFFCGY